MLPKTLIRGFDEGRLRKLLVLFFLALAIPTTVLVWQAYNQLKWEAFHQYRGVAEELTGRIDARFGEMIRSADGRSFADYTFLVVSGDPSARFVQRSPLSAYPVNDDVPGALGYFQVDADGVFSTPLLPPDGTPAANLGISNSEFVQRLQLAEEIQTILAENRLVHSRQGFGSRGRVAPPAARSSAAPEEQKELDEYDERAASGFRDAMSTDEDTIDDLAATPAEKVAVASETYDQQIFDQLNQPAQDSGYLSSEAGTPASADSAGKSPSPQRNIKSIGKVSDLKLDANRQNKSEELEREEAENRFGTDGRQYATGRSKRKEQIALPESSRPDSSDRIANVSGPPDLRIATFESEIDPFDFSLLDSGHFVLFRKVWRDGERFIQGLLIDQAAFNREVIGASFMDTSLSDMSNLIIAYQVDVIETLGRYDRSRYPNVADELGGELLYRSRLSAPLDSLELIFGIERLPPGPGANILAWVTLVLAVVFAGGFVSLYRMGLSQINLARQQQDFVSAVSHELKSPLTSIRMYGEMLKEGWADEEKRQSYYEFIHDESERLSRLIANVLQLARITRNEPQFDMQPTEVGELMSSVQSKISNQVERAGFELRFNRDEDADRARIDIDKDSFAQIIINLVDNAIKFSGNAQEKRIDIGSQLGGDNRVHFSVRDYGPGIPKEQMKKIFQLFYRSESELTRETVGTGIGLAIVHQLTGAMNGDVDLSNTEPGAEFTVSFPV